jgi:oxygen-independent coproporphyrinogen-3 oxidase
MLVNADTGAIDHDDLAIESLGNRRQQPIPDPGFAPSHEPVIAGGVGA